MGKLNLLHHKSYHPYKADNVARVERDEAKARAEEEEVDRRSTLAVRSSSSALSTNALTLLSGLGGAY